ncbi:MAG: copper chaperone PCu(A)C [Pseudolabrys sp.]
MLLALALSAPAFAAPKGVTVEKPWIRLIIKARPAAGYFTLRNGGDKPVTLVGAQAKACGMTMLHQSKQVNGVAKMVHIKSVTVKPHGTLKFEPGSYHIMCMKPQMARGDSVPVTLKFADGDTLTAQFPVKGPGGK